MILPGETRFFQDTRRGRIVFRHTPQKTGRGSGLCEPFSEPLDQLRTKPLSPMVFAQQVTDVDVGFESGEEDQPGQSTVVGEDGECFRFGFTVGDPFGCRGGELQWFRQGGQDGWRQERGQVIGCCRRGGPWVDGEALGLEGHGGLWRKTRIRQRVLIGSIRNRLRFRAAITYFIHTNGKSFTPEERNKAEGRRDCACPFGRAGALVVDVSEL